MTILEKLSELQNRLNVPKKQYNSFGNYYFRNCDDIMEASKPICKELKCVITCTDDMVEKNNRYYVSATATLHDLESDNAISTTSYAREEETKKGMDGSQITGSSSSYARKYALNGLLQLDDNKDADTNEFHKTTSSKSTKTSMVTPEQITKIHTLFTKLGIDDKKKLAIYSKYKVHSSKELTFDNANGLIKSLESNVK